MASMVEALERTRGLRISRSAETAPSSFAGSGTCRLDHVPESVWLWLVACSVFLPLSSRGRFSRGFDVDCSFLCCSWICVWLFTPASPRLSVNSLYSQRFLRFEAVFATPVKRRHATPSYPPKVLCSGAVQSMYEGWRQRT